MKLMTTNISSSLTLSSTSSMPQARVFAFLAAVRRTESTMEWWSVDPLGVGWLALSPPQPPQPAHAIFRQRP